MSLLRLGVPIAVLAIGTLLWSAGAAPQKLLRDPFERPKATPVAKSESEAATKPEWKPELRAVMYDQGRSLVNIGGKIFAVGESMAGYRLIKVEERSAVLLKDGVQIKLMLDKERLR